jgi:predicted ATP-dependent serine protease
MNNRAVSDIAGREAEQATLAAFLERVPSGTRALLIRGEPGIGKTTLWLEAVERARRAGFSVLVTRPAEEELTLALAGLVDLFEHEAADAAALAAEEDPLARGRAVLAGLRAAAGRGPALVAIDDLQWLDSPCRRSAGSDPRASRPGPAGPAGASPRARPRATPRGPSRPPAARPPRQAPQTRGRP